MLGAAADGVLHVRRGSCNDADGALYSILEADAALYAFQTIISDYPYTQTPYHGYVHSHPPVRPSP